MTTAVAPEAPPVPGAAGLRPEPTPPCANSLDFACQLLANVRGRWQFATAGANWADYQRVLAARTAAGRAAVRITYSSGEVEIVTVGTVHERWKSVLSLLLRVYLEETGTPSVCCGGMTISREELDRGFEPDDCFYLTNAGRVLGFRQLDFAKDPPPDLAIEIEVTRKMIDKLPVYSAFRVPEVWRFDGSALAPLALQPDGSYAEQATSKTLPSIPLGDLVRFARLAETTDDSSLARRFRDFVRTLPPAG